MKIESIKDVKGSNVKLHMQGNALKLKEPHKNTHLNIKPITKEFVNK